MADWLDKILMSHNCCTPGLVWMHFEGVMLLLTSPKSACIVMWFISCSNEQHTKYETNYLELMAVVFPLSQLSSGLLWAVRKITRPLRVCRTWSTPHVCLAAPTKPEDLRSVTDWNNKFVFFSRTYMSTLSTLLYTLKLFLLHSGWRSTRRLHSVWLGHWWCHAPGHLGPGTISSLS